MENLSAYNPRLWIVIEIIIGWPKSDEIVIFDGFFSLLFRFSIFFAFKTLFSSIAILHLLGRAALSVRHTRLPRLRLDFLYQILSFKF